VEQNKTVSILFEQLIAIKL